MQRWSLSAVLFTVLLKARMEPFTTKSDFARMAATEIAFACQRRAF